MSTDASDPGRAFSRNRGNRPKRGAILNGSLWLLFGECEVGRHERNVGGRGGYSISDVRLVGRRTGWVKE